MTTTAVRDPQTGRPIYAGTGAVHQHGGPRPVRRCECGQEIVWVESPTTGKHYAANVTKNFNGARYYMGHNLHHCRPAEPTPVRETAEYHALTVALRAVSDPEARIAVLEEMARMIADAEAAR